MSVQIHTKEDLEEVFDSALCLFTSDRRVEDFLFYIFSFLKKRTDFYVIVHDRTITGNGFFPGEAEEIVKRAFRSQTPKLDDSPVTEPVVTELKTKKKRVRADNRNLDHSTSSLQRRKINHSSLDEVQLAVSIVRELSSPNFIMSNYHNGCKKRLTESSHVSSCLSQLFQPNNVNKLSLDQFCCLIAQTRSATLLKSSEEQLQHLRQLFQNSIIHKYQLRLRMKYKVHGTEVCMGCFAFAHGTSSYTLEELSKEQRKKKPKNNGCKSFTENTVLPFTYRETEDMLLANNCHADEDIVKMGAVPLSGAQLFCVSWMKRYFSVYADQAPNQDISYLALVEKKEIFENYLEEFQHYKDVVTTVDESTFLTLWLTVFPRVVQRAFCDVMGKCKTCAEIDARRRNSESHAVAEAVKMARQLHRSGLFMPERERYYDRVYYAMDRNRREPGEQMFSYYVNS